MTCVKGCAKTGLNITQSLTFAAFFISHQFVSCPTEALKAHSQILADVRASAILGRTLIDAWKMGPKM